MIKKEIIDFMSINFKSMLIFNFKPRIVMWKEDQEITTLIMIIITIIKKQLQIKKTKHHKN